MFSEKPGEKKNDPYAVMGIILSFMGMGITYNFFAYLGLLCGLVALRRLHERTDIYRKGAGYAKAAITYGIVFGPIVDIVFWYLIDIRWAQ